MSKLEKMVDSPTGMEGFRAKYHIPPEVGLEYCSLEEVLIKRRTGQVAIPVIAFVEGGMTIPMGRITRDYLRGHRLSPYQRNPLFGLCRQGAYDSSAKFGQRPGTKFPSKV